MNTKRISEYMQYIKLRPAPGYYKVFTLRFFGKILKSLRLNEGKLLPHGIMIIKFKGIKGIVRSTHEDLLYYSGAAKLAFTESWFNPQPGENVIDVGSNVGRYSLIAAKKDANVIAIEANPQTFEVLSENCKLNGFMNIEPLNVACSNKSGSLILYYVDGYDGIASVDKKWAELNGLNRPRTEFEIQCEKLDNLHSFNKVDWLLIDVEGHELEVLESAVHTLSITKRIIIEVEHEYRKDVVNILKGFVLIKEAVELGLNSYLLFERKEDYNSGD
jgi:FkbM family methyltransferase